MVLVVNVANSLFCNFNTLTGQPVVLNTDGQEWLGKVGTRRTFLLPVLSWIAKNGATALIADCATMADVYEREFGAHSTVIPYCFQAISFESDLAVLDRYEIKPDGYYIITGPVNPENNIDTVVETYARSSATLPLLVLGAGGCCIASAGSARCTRPRRTTEFGWSAMSVTVPEFLSLITLAATYIHGHSVGGMNPSLVEAMGAGALIAALDTTFNRDRRRHGSLLRGGLRRRGRRPAEPRRPLR